MMLFNVARAAGIAALLSISAAFAQVAPAEQLLPEDTLGVLTIPDWKKFMTDTRQSAWGQLWEDPAMKPFRDNFVSNFQADFLKPLEKQLEIKLADFQELLQGQITVALTVPREGTGELLDLMLLIDTKEKGELLTSKLSELRKKWTDAGKTVQTERIRDVEFSSITFTAKEVSGLMEKAFPSRNAEDDDDEETPAAAEKIQLWVGQQKSLLIIAENSKAIEKLLARQAGGLVLPLAEKAAYQRVHAQLFRDSIAHAWVDIKPILRKVLEMAQQEKSDPEPGMPSFSVDKVLPALGFGSIETIAGKIGAGADSSFEAMIGAPEAQREGIVKVLTPDRKDSAPPAFVPADVTKFQRTRIDLQKGWATLERMVSSIDPMVAGLVQLMLSTAGKDKDPDFDLKKNLIGNLGDDVIQYEKAPKEMTPEGAEQMPSLTLVGSPNPTQLLDALRMITSLLPPPLSSAPLKEREFLGKKIYSLSFGDMSMMAGDVGAGSSPGEPAAQAGRTFSFASSGGYVAMSTDAAILEEFLRSGENPPKPLREVPGFAEAAQKVGGTDTGYFQYENQIEGMRLWIEVIKKDPDTFGQALFFNFTRGEEDETGVLGRLVDFKLLPSFERISKYFGILVTSAGATPEGFVIKAVSPQPAGLK